MTETAVTVSPWRAEALPRALALGALTALAGCGDSPGRQKGLYLQPLPLQQRQVYPETVTGRFVSLGDFEDSPLTGQDGHTQLRHWAISPPGGGNREYVVNLTRTGAGAMEVFLPTGSSLVYRPPKLHDFSAYTLLLMALHVGEIRDDLKVRLTTDRAGWESLPVLLRPGWNSVLIDLERLKRLGDFKARRVRSIVLSFAASPRRSRGGARPGVRLNVDDVMLIDNRREISPAPKGMRLVKSGLDYVLHVGGGRRPIRIRQCDDGLWRLGPDQAVVELFSPAGGGLAGRVREDLSPFGQRRVGEVAILEANALRLRIANTWYFPASAGEWASLAVRQVRWEYTFYADGRQVTDVVLNNAGGKDVSALRIQSPAPAAWSDGTRGAVLNVPRFGGSVGRWSFLTATGSKHGLLYESNYVKPGRVEVRIGKREACDGDVEADGFDESQGCYHLRAKDGNCRFLLKPGGGPLADPVIRVAGGWGGGVTASSEGLALRKLVALPGGTVLFVIPGVLSRPRWVEVSGAVGLLGGG